MNKQFGYVKDGKVFLKSFRKYPDRAIGEVKDTEENAINYFINRFSVIKGKVDTLVKNVETAQNKGSFLMSLLHLKEAVPQYDALGDFDSLMVLLEKAEGTLGGLININRQKNKEIKTALIEEARLAAQNPDWKEATALLTEINGKWIKTGKAEKDIDEELDHEFREIYGEFYSRKKAFYEEIQALYVVRLATYTSLMEKAKDIWRKKGHPGELKVIQTAWKEVGNVPKVMLFPVMKEYRRIVKDIIKTHKFAKGPDTQSYAKWESLCEEVEKMISTKDFSTPEKIKKIQENWRNAGKLPSHKMEILQRFTTAIDKYFEVSYLENTMKRKYPGIELRSTREQLEAKVVLMKEFIRREKLEIDNHNAELSNVRPGDADADAELVIKKKLAFQNKRLDNKMRLLEDIQRNLLAI